MLEFLVNISDEERLSIIFEKITQIAPKNLKVHIDDNMDIAISFDDDDPAGGEVKYTLIYRKDGSHMSSNWGVGYSLEHLLMYYVLTLFKCHIDFRVRLQFFFEQLQIKKPKNNLDNEILKNFTTDWLCLSLDAYIRQLLTQCFRDKTALFAAQSGVYQFIDDQISVLDKTCRRCFETTVRNKLDK